MLCIRLLRILISMTNRAQRARRDPYTAERFLSNVRKDVGPDGCWLWEGPGRSAYGYAHLYDPPRSIAADGQVNVHVWAHLEWVGPVPAGYQVDHLCHVPGCTFTDEAGTCLHRRCVRPDHLKAVTPGENARRSGSIAAINAAKEACDHGHPFSPENTSRNPDGSRACRKCSRATKKRNSGRVSPTKRELLYCLTADCGLPQWRYGLCQRHSWDLEQEAERVGSRPQDIQKCGASGCSAVGTQSLGFCSMHYSRYVRTGNLESQRPTRGHEGCSVQGCDRKHYGNGFCEAHYKAYRKYGDPRGDQRPRNPEKCRRGDGMNAKARGYCPRHYNELRVAVARGETTWESEIEKDTAVG